MLLSVFLHYKKLFRKKKQTALFKAKPWSQIPSLLLLSTLSFATLLFSSFYYPIMFSLVLTLSQICRILTPILHSLMDACFFCCLFLFLLAFLPHYILPHFPQTHCHVFITFFFLHLLPLQAVKVILCNFFL